MLSSRSMETGVALRALAIVMVVFNHAHPGHWSPLGLGGGMMFLMLLSGQNFAKFALGPATEGRQVVRASLKLAWEVFWPSLLVVLLWFVLRRSFNVYELFFVRNLVDTERLAKFPVWYVQVLIQMMVMIAGAFLVRPVATFALGRPRLFATLVWLVFLIVRVAAFAPTTDGSTERKFVGHLPTSWFFDFALGWMIYHFVDRAEEGEDHRLFISVALVVSGFLTSWPDELHFYWFVFGGLALVWLDTVRTPDLLARLLEITSQATFTIFILHRMFFVVCEYAPGGYLANFDVKFVIALVGTITSWVVLSAARRAWIRLRS